MELLEAYPDREGGKGQIDAAISYSVAMGMGFTHQRIVEAINRYAAYCDAKGLIGTAFVKKIGTFLRDREALEATWEVRDGQDEHRANDGRRLTPFERVAKAYREGAEKTPAHGS